MKNIIILTYFQLLFTILVNGQVSTNDIPYGLLSDLELKSSIPQLKLGNVDIKQSLNTDDFIPIPYDYCSYIDTIINLKQVSNKLDAEGGTIWSYNIYTENAKSLNIYLKHFEVPNGAKLFVYNKNDKNYLGAFTNINQKTDKTLQIADLINNELTIEYFEPNDAEIEGEIIIGSIGLGYRDLTKLLTTEDFIDINCEQGNDWQLEKHAVCKITFRSGLTGYQCTGSLINTTANDGTPYFLTANHCISDETEAGTAVVYFNEEKSECGGTTVVAANQSVSGAQLTATSATTDFTLLLLDETPPANYQPYYIGWSRDETEPNYAVTIHHPSEMTKMISVDNDPISSYPFVLNWPGNNQSPPNSHWEVRFDEGVTISGSSGGPLLNPKGQVIGQLHGGDISGNDYYGKIAESWDVGILDSRRLKPWLDPLNSNPTEINGFIPNGVVPDAHFSTELKTVCINHPIQFTNHSVLNPDSYEWDVTPPDYQFVSGTSSASENPVIQFNNPGTYTVSLQAENENGINFQVYNDYIEAGNTISPNYEVDRSNYCYYEFNKIEIAPSGAENFYWLTNEIDDLISSSINENNNIVLSLKTNPDSTYSAELKLVGEQGSCIDTSDISITIDYAFNDDIQNAHQLKIGNNGPFRNNCATVQSNEPEPPYGTNCTGANYWCDDYGNGSLIVENSTWYSFIAPESGNATIKTNGIDSQIALYEADNAEDIVSGNLNLYDIIVANDDYTDSNPNAQIDSIVLTPNKRYWIQLDGYQGAEGTFTIEIIDNLQSDIKDLLIELPIEIYPIPSNNGIFNIDNKNYIQEEYQLNVYHINGKMLHSEIIYPETKILNLSKLSAGIYVVQILQDDNIYQGKILISY